MSGSEILFLHSGLSLDGTAAQLSDVLGFTVEREGDKLFLIRPEGNGGDRLVGKLTVNYLTPEPEPEPPHTIDRYPLMWDLYRKAVPDWQRQRQAVRSVFDDVVGKLGWPVLLTHDAQTAIADWSAMGVCGTSRQTPPWTTYASNHVSPELHRLTTDGGRWWLQELPPATQGRPRSAFDAAFDQR